MGRGNTSRVSDPFSAARVRAAYDLVAKDYRDAFGDDLDRLPLDCRMLDHVHARAEAGAILDLGCGSGSAAAYLAAHGARVVGLDLSAGMLRECGRACGFARCQGDMRRLPFSDGSFAAVVAYYSLHHVPRSELGAVLAEASRVLVPGGPLLLGTHLGDGEVYADTFLGHDIARTGGTLYTEAELTERVSSAGFTVRTSALRQPLSNERQSQRIYLLAARTRDLT